MGANERESVADVSTGGGAPARMKKNLTDKAQDAKASTANALAWTATSLHSRTDKMSRLAHSATEKTATSLHSQTDKMSKLAHSAADRIQVGADYLRKRDVERIMDDVRGLVKKYPGRSLAVAGISVFLIVRLFRRSSHDKEPVLAGSKAVAM
jgi:hypothetical protein